MSSWAIWFLVSLFLGLLGPGALLIGAIIFGIGLGLGWW